MQNQLHCIITLSEIKKQNVYLPFGVFDRVILCGVFALPKKMKVFLSSCDIYWKKQKQGKFIKFLSLDVMFILEANKNQLSVNLLILAFSLASMSESAGCSRVPVCSEYGHRLQNQASIRG